jgi:hypothetical protein
VAGVKLVLKLKYPMINCLNKILLILLLTPPVLLSQSVSQKFLDALLHDKDNIADFINKETLARSKSFGITYTGVQEKALLTYEIPQKMKEDVVSGKQKIEISESTEGKYTVVSMIIPAYNYSKIYYFDQGFIPVSEYMTRQWPKLESKYFKFRLEEAKYFNDYCIKRLDDFVDMMADSLRFTKEERELLEKEKILYTFCTDEKGVERITGFRSKGMALLANEEIVTAYQTHFHEVAHILINYKLKNLGLFTLPFFMEGFAVAMGGRGGMAPRVVTDIGSYLQQTEFLTYDSIFTNEQFYSNDLNMSYAVSGLYNMFLIDELGIMNYLELYTKVNGDLKFVSNIVPAQIDLPSRGKFDAFMSEYNSQRIMYMNEKDTLRTELDSNVSNGNFEISGNYIKFFVKEKYSVGFSGYTDDYYSRRFTELYKTDKKCYFKYCFLTGKESIDIYNLYNDELIFSYSKGLSVNPVSIPKTGEYFNFFISSDLFGGDFESETIFQDGTFR